MPIADSIHPQPSPFLTSFREYRDDLNSVEISELDYATSLHRDYILTKDPTVPLLDVVDDNAKAVKKNASAYQHTASS